MSSLPSSGSGGSRPSGAADVGRQQRRRGQSGLTVSDLLVIAVAGAAGLAAGMPLSRLTELVLPSHVPSPETPGRGRTGAARAEAPPWWGIGLVTAPLFMAAAVRFGADWALPAYLVFFAALVIVSLVDVQSRVIPTRVVGPAILLCSGLLAVATAAHHDWSRFGTSLLGAALAGGSLLTVHLVTPAGMGFGDVRLATLIGLALGWLSLGTVALGMFLAFLFAAAVGVGVRRLRGSTTCRHVPLGPYLAAGAVAAVLLGEQIIRWYAGLAG